MVAFFSQASAMLLREWKKIKAINRERKRCSELHKAEKQIYEENIQQYQEDNPEKVKITSLHKRWNKTGAKVDAKESAKTGVKTLTLVLRLLLKG